MAHTIYMGTFNKRLNSTKQPTYTGWTSYSCVFKDETSLYRPTVRIAADFATFASANYNYAVMLNKYYYIQDVRSIRAGYIEVDMAIDPLATYKSSITGTSAFIEYGFNTFDASDQNTRFPDNRVSVNVNPTAYTESADVSGGMIDAADGCYIVQAVGNNPNGAHKGLATFALSAAQLREMMSQVYGGANGLDATINNIMSNTQLSAQDVMNELTSLSLKTELLNESAMAAIQSVKWLPFKLSNAVGTLTNLYLGNYDTGIASALMLTQNTRYWVGTDIDIPWPVTDWKRNNCQIILYLPFFGTVPIPVDQCINYDHIGISWSAEYFSGSISVVVNAGNVFTLYTGSTNLSVDMGVGRSMVGASAMIGGGIQALGGVLQMAGGIADIGASAVGSFLGIGGGFAGAAANIGGGAQNVLQGYAQTVQPAITCAGSMGGMAAIAQNKLATVELLYYPPIDEGDMRAKYGHPVFAVDTPVTGFCKARGFSVSLSAPGYICAAINDIVNGGIFIE